jgi:predicted O-linked N-acetylglucosamine transferase (SPINDLY family)
MKPFIQPFAPDHAEHPGDQAAGDPDEPGGLNRLGGALLESGNPESARRCFQRAVEIDPGFTEAFFNLGLAYRALGSPDTALQCLAQALNLKPDFFQALFVIGNIHLDGGQSEKAIACFRGVLASAPGFAEAHYNLGNALNSIGETEQAAASYRRAIRIRPGFAAALNNLGLVFKEAGRLQEAVQCYEQALAVKPEMVEAHYNLGIAAQLDGQFYRGLEHYAQALAYDSQHAPARWLHDLSLPIVYQSPEEIPRQRRRFAENLERLVRETPLSTEAECRRALAGVGSTTHFFLQYQAQNDRALQEAYGDFVHRVMRANYPQWSQRRRMPPVPAGGRIRLGYVSSFMRAHTVGSFLLGWLEAHCRGRFEIFCYHIGQRVDALTERLRERSDRFHQIGGHLERAAAAILGDDLHLLVYTDVGMNALATQLAALRLAPVQCKGWGHPVTTGLPTIDYYLTSDLMEPQDAEAHYSETLIRLPGLALNFSPPPLPERPKSRSDFGLEEEAFVYLSTQSLFKYLPRHDDVYPRIAAAVPNARFVFLAHAHAGVTRQFAERLAAAFRSYRLPFERHCRILPRLELDDFLSLNLVSDVLLDTLEWSGGKTTLEAIGCGTPVVTCPGGFMRGRHAFAMLKKMDLAETIAADKDDYVRIAAGLGRRPEWAAAVRSRLADRKDRLFGDREFMRALEAFFSRIAGRPGPDERTADAVPGDAAWTP